MINNQTTEQAENFNYLGCDLSFNHDKELQNKLFKLQHMCDMCETIIRTPTNKTTKDTQLMLYNAMAVPILLHGCKNWAYKRANKRRIETAQMKLLRKVASHTLRD